MFYLGITEQMSNPQSSMAVSYHESPWSPFGPALNFMGSMDVWSEAMLTGGLRGESCRAGPQMPSCITLILPSRAGICTLWAPSSVPAAPAPTQKGELRKYLLSQLNSVKGQWWQEVSGTLSDHLGITVREPFNPPDSLTPGLSRFPGLAWPLAPTDLLFPFP